MNLNRENGSEEEQLRNDTGLRSEELMKVMGNREEWMKLVNNVRVCLKYKTKEK